MSAVCLVSTSSHPKDCLLLEKQKGISSAIHDTSECPSSSEQITNNFTHQKDDVSWSHSQILMLSAALKKAVIPLDNTYILVTTGSTYDLLAGSQWYLHVYAGDEPASAGTLSYITVLIVTKRKHIKYRLHMKVPDICVSLYFFNFKEMVGVTCYWWALITLD